MATKKAVIQASVLTGSTAIAVAPGAAVEVRTPAGALASLWQDRDGAVGQANPLTADAAGAFRCYADQGRYKIKTTYGAEIVEWFDVVVKARHEPELPLVVMANVDDGSNPQQNLLFDSGKYFGGLTGHNAHQLIWDALDTYDPLTKALLTLAASGGTQHTPNKGHFTIEAGPPGILEVSWALSAWIWNVTNNVASLTTEEIEIYAFLRTLDGAGNPVLVPGSGRHDIVRATTGFTNEVTLHGTDTIVLAANTAVDVALMLVLISQSGTKQGFKLDIGNIALRRLLDEDD